MGGNICTCGRITSVLWADNRSVLWRVFSTVEGYLQYCGGIPSVLWRDTFSTVEGYLQYCGGITAVHVGGSFSTVGGYFSTVEVVQYSGGYHQYSGG